MGITKIEGNPIKFTEKVLEEAYARFMNELKEEIEKAYSTSLSIVDSALEVSLKRGLKVISERYQSFKDELLSFEASLDRSIRLEKQQLEAHYVEKVLDTVYGMLLKLSVDEKKALYGPILSSLVDRISEGKIIVFVNPNERDLIGGILPDNINERSIEVIIEPSIDSGFILTNENRTIFYDYTLRTMYESIKPHLMSKARITLFGR